MFGIKFRMDGDIDLQDLKQKVSIVNRQVNSIFRIPSISYPWNRNPQQQTEHIQHLRFALFS